MPRKIERNKVIQAKNLSYSYASQSALEKVTFDVIEKDFFGVVGPNGGGKTTLLKLILGLLTPMKGEISVFGKTPRESRRMIGYVPQYAKFDFDFPINVEEVVLTGRLGMTSIFGPYRAEDRAAAYEAIKSVGITHLSGRRLGSLSGGERQRVLIARALVSNPSLLLLDEPTASVDIGAEESIYELLKELNNRITIILVSHDIGFVASYVDKVACINKILVCHPASKLTSQDILSMYGEPVHHIHHDTELKQE
jgi:zinc transport system ATP-binding protein